MDMRIAMWGRRMLAAGFQIISGVAAVSLAGMAVVVLTKSEEIPTTGLIAGVLLFPAVALYGAARFLGPKSRWKDALYWTAMLGITALLLILLTRSDKTAKWSSEPFGRHYNIRTFLALLLACSGAAGYLWLRLVSEKLLRSADAAWSRFGQTTRMIAGAILTFLACAAAGWVYMVFLARPVVKEDYLAAANRLRMSPVCNDTRNGAHLFEQARELVNQAPPPEATCMATIDNGSWQTLGRTVWLTWPGDMNDVQIWELRQWVASNKGALEKLEEALADECFGIELKSEDGSLLKAQWPGTAADRNLAYAVQWRARLRAFDGDTAGAMNDVHLLDQISLFAGRAPLLLEWLVGLAYSSLARVTAREIMTRIALSDEQLAQMAAGFQATEQTRVGLAAVMPTERLYLLDFLQRYYTDAPFGRGRLSIRAFCNLRPNEQFAIEQHVQFKKVAGPAAIAAYWAVYCFGSGDRGTLVRREDELGRQITTLCEKAPYELREMGVDIDKMTKVRDALFAPRAYSAVRSMEMWHRHRNDLAGTQAVIAIMRYKQREGRFPDSLERLVEGGYISELPVDVYSGRSLVYRLTEKGFTLYSVGRNGADDGGRRAFDADDMMIWPMKP